MLEITGCFDSICHRHLEYYLKSLIDFAIKCQKALAMCAKAVYNNNAIL
jgi:hypothetical protein